MDLGRMWTRKTVGKLPKQQTKGFSMWLHPSGLSGVCVCVYPTDMCLAGRGANAEEGGGARRRV